MNYSYYYYYYYYKTIDLGNPLSWQSLDLENTFICLDVFSLIFS